MPLSLIFVSSLGDDDPTTLGKQQFAHHLRQRWEVRGSQIFQPASFYLAVDFVSYSNILITEGLRDKTSFFEIFFHLLVPNMYLALKIFEDIFQEQRNFSFFLRKSLGL